MPLKLVNYPCYLSMSHKQVPSLMSLMLNIASRSLKRMASRRGLYPTNIASFYNNMIELYSVHSYKHPHIWDNDESGIQAGRNDGDRVSTHKGLKCAHCYRQQIAGLAQLSKIIIKVSKVSPSLQINHFKIFN